MGRTWFPLYAADLLVDGDVARLTDREFRMLIQLWCRCCLDGSVPSDPSKLARLMGWHGNSTRNGLDFVAIFFNSDSRFPGQMVSKRMEAETLKYSLIIERNRTNGAKGGRPPKPRRLFLDNPEITESQSQSQEDSNPLPPLGSGELLPEAVQEKKKPKTKPKPKNANYQIKATMLPPEVQTAFLRCWDGWPREGFNFSLKTNQPRRVNQARAAERFLALCQNLNLATADGTPIGPTEIADATLAWVDRITAETRKRYPPEVGPPVPCIDNFFSADPASKKYWQEAILEAFGVGA